MRVIDVIAMILLLIGGINWGLIGAFDFNIITWLFGMIPALMKLVYILVGLSALWLLFQWKGVCKRCSSKR
jgi:uncharacterized membrane protein YuzA (DUF378 family)